MKICIVYGSRRGSTEKVAEIIGEILRRKRFDVCTWRVDQCLDMSRCNIVIIGTPIYYERPLPEVVNFLREWDGLKEKKVAIFILSMAQKFGKLGKRYTEEKYLHTITKMIKGDVIATEVFDGWILGENRNTIAKAMEWGTRIAGILSGNNTDMK